MPAEPQTADVNAATAAVMEHVLPDGETLANTLYEAWYFGTDWTPEEQDTYIRSLCRGIATAALKAVGDQAVRPVWRHIKRGTVYTELGRAELQMNTDLVEGAFLVIYRGDDGKLWARPEPEFKDGRFERVESNDHE